MDILRKLIFVLLVSLPGMLPAAQVININTADKTTLMNIDGVGEKRAEAIIAYREQHGPFTSVDQLLEVQGVGESILKNNRENLTVKDEQ